MNRIVVITGASSGLGLSTYKKFESMKDIPICLGLNNDVNLKNYIHCDITDEQNVISAFEEIAKTYGHVDILINNAGVATSGAIEFEEKKSISSTFNVNVIGATLCYQNALKYMSENGKIINISSICSPCPVPFRAIYSASKSALSTLSYCAYMELKNCKIHPVAITLGQTKTDLEKHRINNVKTNDRYGNRIERNLKDLQKDQSKRMTSEEVANKIFKISNKKAPKPMYIVGAKYKFVYFLSKILPLKTFLNITNKFLDF